MKNFLLMLLGKGINNYINDSAKGVFRSDCYYNWIKFRILTEFGNPLNNNFEDLLVANYNEEIKLKQEMMSNDLHVQQGIIALPADDEDEESSYNSFLNEINNASVVFISFINIPSWSKKEREEIISSYGLDGSVNEIVKKEILKFIDKSSMRLFHTFDHNDFVIICNGQKTKLEEYLKILEKIKYILLNDKYFVVHDITTIYGYKSTETNKLDTANSINAVVSVSGQDIVSSHISSSFRMEIIGRYDHLSGYKNITWYELSEISKKLQSDDIIASRIHIGCNTSNDSIIKACENKFSQQKTSSLYDKFKKMYEIEVSNIKFEKLVEIYGGDEDYVDSIKLILNEIGFVIKTILKRGFSKYNIVCYIESYMCFLKYIQEKIIFKLDNISNNDPNLKNNTAKDLAEDLVDISNSFYKNILMLDSSIMHSERRFILSDPYQLTLFDVPPKLIAYYTSIASEMARELNGDSENKYVFLITPDIKKDIYVESITDNRDINQEINILVIHINERNIYDVTNTTRNIAHEIAHHVGQNQKLRKVRAYSFIKCYIALLIKNCLDSDIFSTQDSIDYASWVIEQISKIILVMIKKSDFFHDINKYYYMDDLKEKFHLFLIEKLRDIDKITPILCKIFLKYFNTEVITNYIKKSEISFVDIDNIDLSSDAILKEYFCKMILGDVCTRIENYLGDSNRIIEDMKCIEFVFKEGYADIQMILLTNEPNFDNNTIKEYSQLFERVKDKTDEMLRKYAVINALLDEVSRNYEAILNMNLIKKDNILGKAYFVYICKQATLYFLKVKNNNNNNIFDYHKTSLFKNNETNEIIQQVDNTIENYIEVFCKELNFEEENVKFEQ